MSNTMKNTQTNGLWALPSVYLQAIKECSRKGMVI